MVSQFLHGEQGALICTAQIAQSVPWVDAKLFAASQVADEARHVEAYARYLDTKMPFTFPVNPDLRSLLDFVVADPRWDMTYLGMQIMVEGLALAFFAFQHRTTSD
ncbi:MAG: ferritin-like domain-containing protein, partial [Actinomycetota bacterium]|nr:ferritin-like domain-containing protein [Actinomycetota bacterium]